MVEAGDPLVVILIVGDILVVMLVVLDDILVLMVVTGLSVDDGGRGGW